MHKGVDIGLPEGSPVYAIDSGTVTYAGWQDEANPKAGGGLFVKISHTDNKDSLYMHLSKLEVSNKQEVKAGQLIGLSGKTGRVVGKTGEHLHLEIRQDNVARQPTSEEIRVALSGQPSKER